MPKLTVLAASSLAVASAVSLPSSHAVAGHDGSKWAVHVGDTVYTSPPAAMVELSQDISHYYYAAGSHSALTEDMKKHRVGGEGRWHIFHLPEGPSMLQLQSNGDRRETFSSLVQLEQDAKLPKTFPHYEVAQTYVKPAAKALELERAAVEHITPAVFEGYLRKITELGDNSSQTRAWDNDKASGVTQNFLKEQFDSLGVKTCLQTFQKEGFKGKGLANVVAYIPGTSADTFTVGAHYDSRPYEGAAPGAEDNGSGLAGMLTIAAAFVKAKLKPVRNLYFVGYAAEEPGLLGSSAWANALAEDGVPEECAVKEAESASFLSMKRSGKKELPKHACIALDEIGWKSPSLNTSVVNLEAYDWTADLMNHLAEASKTHNGDQLEVVHNSHPFGSDHMSFLDKNWTGVLIINGDDEAYPNYHASTDTIDNVDFNYSTLITKMVFGGMVRGSGL